MEIKEEKVGDAYKINLIGRMDIPGVGEIETRFAGMCASPRTAIIVDMSNVSYMSSIGIRVLILNSKAVNKRGGKFVILNPKDVVRNVLEVSGIDKMLFICENLEQALLEVKQ